MATTENYEFMLENQLEFMKCLLKFTEFFLSSTEPIDTENIRYDAIIETFPFQILLIWI